jgi:putative transcriptional regulator
MFPQPLSDRAEIGDQAMNESVTFVRIRPDGTLVRVETDGAEEALPVERPRPAIPASRSGEPRAKVQGLTIEDIPSFRNFPRVETLRQGLALSQEEFSARYQIPLGMLRDWEQNRSEPDRPMRAYLTVIARDPEAVLRALQDPA